MNIPQMSLDDIIKQNTPFHNNAKSTIFFHEYTVNILQVYLYPKSHYDNIEKHTKICFLKKK